MIALDQEKFTHALRLQPTFALMLMSTMIHRLRLAIARQIREDERAEEEEAKAKELGLRYFNIPVVYRDPKEEQATEFLRITDDPANRPAFIHCTAAIRVGAFWLIRRVLRDGWTFEAAEKEAEKVGLRESPHLNEFARKYIGKHQKKS